MQNTLTDFFIGAYFQNMTRGLMGNWTFDIDDDFTLPSGREQAVFQTDDIKGLHNEFGMKCNQVL